MLTRRLRGAPAMGTVCEHDGMTGGPSLEVLGRAVRDAFVNRDVDAFAALLDDDVRWGVVGHPRSCRGRSQVVATFSRVLAEGTDGDLISLRFGDGALLCELEVRDFDGGGAVRTLYQLLTVCDGKITEIRPFDRASDAEAIAGPTRLLGSA